MNRMTKAQSRWIFNLLEQHPAHQELINKAKNEALDKGYTGTDFGDHVLGCLEEAGADV